MNTSNNLRRSTFCNDGCIATKSPRERLHGCRDPNQGHGTAMRNKYGHRDTVMADTDNSPKKIMAEWGSNAAAPLKITSEPGWSPTPTPMATICCYAIFLLAKKGVQRILSYQLDVLFTFLPSSWVPPSPGQANNAISFFHLLYEWYLCYSYIKIIKQKQILNLGFM